MFGGLLTSYDAREAVKADTPAPGAPLEEVVVYTLNVLWALHSREVVELLIGASGRILGLEPKLTRAKAEKLKLAVLRHEHAARGGGAVPERPVV
jgi:hypothetical protein